MAKRSIILVVVDGMRPDHLSAYGYHKDTTPYLTQLASRGRVFTNAYTTCNLTVSALMTFYTGLHAAQHGVVQTRSPSQFTKVGCNHKHIASRMRKQGYITACITKASRHAWFLATKHGFHHPIDPGRRHETAYVMAADVVNHAVEFLKWCAGRPYFMVLHFLETRRPFLCPKRYHPRPAAKMGEIERYDTVLRYWDDQFKRLMGHVDADTRWIVTGDHGMYLGERGRKAGHLTLYEHIIRVPLLIGPYEHDTTEYMERMVNQPYVYHTVLGKPHKKNLWHDPRGLRFIVACEGHIQSKWAIHDGQWKLIKALSNRERDGQGMPMALYRLPDETTNLVEQYPEEAVRLDHALKKWQTRRGFRTDPLLACIPLQRRVRVKKWKKHYLAKPEVYT